MKTEEINKAMENYSGFVGTFPSDEIPDIEPNEGVIVNTDTKDKPGTHWIAIYRPEHASVEYFDSFGLPPLIPQIIDYMNKIAGPRGWTYSISSLQHEESDSCGQHCLNFLKHRLLQLPMTHILTHLTADRLKNDYIVKHGM